MKSNLKDDIIKQSSFLENDFCDETIIKLQEIEKSEWLNLKGYENGQ